MFSRPVHNSGSTAPQRSPRFRSWSLATWLTVWYACSAFALVIVATAFLYRTLVRSLDQEEDLFLADNIQNMRQLLHKQPDNMAVLAEEVTENGGYIECYVRILTEGGQVVVETPGMADTLVPNLFPPPIRPDTEPEKGIDIVSSNRQSFRASAARALAGSSSQETRVIQVALSQTKKRGLLAKYRKRLWRALGVALVLCAVIGYEIARRGIQPIREISQAAQRVRSTTLDQRIPMTNLPTELLTLTNIFNEMLARLQESFDQLSQFSANIAHELRTPVNNLRGMAEVTLRGTPSLEDYRDTLGSCLEEYVRLSRLIDSLLLLARADQAQTPISREPLNVVDELRTVRDFYEAAGAEAGVPLTIHAEPDLIVDLDRTLFQRAVGNLVTNALAYTPRGGAITLSASKRQETLCIEVSDTGCGIPPQQLPRVFDRFHRAPPDRSSRIGGTGLGLAIVKSIVTLHGGSTTITSEVDRGTRVTMIFPTFSP